MPSDPEISFRLVPGRGKDEIERENIREFVRRAYEIISSSVHRDPLPETISIAVRKSIAEDPEKEKWTHEKVTDMY